MAFRWTGWTALKFRSLRGAFLQVFQPVFQLAFLLAFLLAFMAAGPAVSFAADRASIKTTVNGIPITTIDLENRTRLLALLSGFDLTEENRAQLEADALDMLTDEMLKLQAGAELPPAIQNRARSAARQLLDEALGRAGQPAKTVLDARNIPLSAALEKFRADILWVSVLQAKFPRQFENLEQLAEQERARLKQNLAEPQFNLTEIVLVPTQTRGPAETRDLAEQITDALGRGADFAGIARQYSVAGSSREGGRLGWLPVSSLPPSFVAQLAQTEDGAVIGPLQHEGGLFILRRLGYRAEGFLDPGRQEMVLARLLVTVPEGSDEAVLGQASAQLLSLAGPANNCADMDQIAKQASGQAAGRLKITVEELDPGLRAVLEGLQPGQKTTVLRFGSDLSVIMLCSRAMPKDNLPTLETLKRAELDKLYSILNSRYLMRLRRAAVIEKQAE